MGGRRRDRERGVITTVYHAGVVGDVPGGMAQVLNSYSSWTYNAIEVRLVRSSRGAGRGWSVGPWISALAKMAASSLSARQSVWVVHLSQGGSFIREGSLILLASVLRVRCAAHLHGSRFVSFSRAHPKLTRAVLARATAVYVLTTESRTAVIKARRCSGAHVVQVVNAVDMPQSVSVKKNFVLFAGELGARKGVDVLVRAWAQLSHPDWTLHLAGPSVAGTSLDPSDGVILHGALPHSTVMNLADQSAIAVLPSRHEALPMFLIETMARGCAIVATDVGEVRGLVGDAGVIVPIGDSHALALALSNLMTNPDLRSRFALSARARVKDQGLDSGTAARRFEELWLELAEAPDGHE